MKTHPTDDLVRRLARVHDDSLRGLVDRPAARTLLDNITAQPPGPTRRPRPRRRLVLGTVATAAALSTAGVATAVLIDDSGDSPPGRHEMRLASAVQITRKDTYYEARIVDPRADRKRFKAAFAKYGLDIDVSLVPASPTVVGTVVMMEEDEVAAESARKIETIGDPSCHTPGGTCTIGLRIPLGFTGHAGIVIGRAAAPGEPYTSTVPQDAPKGLQGKTVAQAETELAREGVRVAVYNLRWTLPSGGGYGEKAPSARVDRRWKVESAEPYAPGAVMLMIKPSGPVPPEVLNKARHNATATPTPTPSQTPTG